MAVPMPNRDPEGEVFDFDKAELANFEVWDRKVSAPAGHGKSVAFVSVLVGGVVGLNRAARELFGPPAAVKVMFDPKNKRIGLIPSDPDDAASFKLGWGQGQVSCKKVFQYYGVEITESKRYRDFKILDGILVVDL